MVEFLDGSVQELHIHARSYFWLHASDGSDCMTELTEICDRYEAIPKLFLAFRGALFLV